MSEWPPCPGHTGENSVQTFGQVYLWGGVFYAVSFLFSLSDLLALVSLNDVLCLLKLQVEKVPSGTQKCVPGLSHVGMEGQTRGGCCSLGC